MGYTTEFEGTFTVTPPLKREHEDYLFKFSDTRRMKRNPVIAETLPDPDRIDAGLPIGPEGAYFVGGMGMCGQAEDASIIEYNRPPVGQPGLWCQWVPGDRGSVIVWNQAEKFYYYTEWLQYLIDHFLGPWGYSVNGEVLWQGEDSGDFGKLVVKGNEVIAKQGKKVY